MQIMLSWGVLGYPGVSWGNQTDRWGTHGQCRYSAVSLITRFDFMAPVTRVITALQCSCTTVCPAVGGDNSRALANGLSPIQVDSPWYNYFIPPSSV